MISVQVFIVLLLSLTSQISSECEVLVPEPWPQPHLLVPVDSTVYINCTADGSSRSDSLYWAIDLSNDSTGIQYQFGTGGKTLNSHGVYELPKIEAEELWTLRLLINDTAMNNQTKIFCNRIDPPSTTLYVYEPVGIHWKDVTTTTNGIDISWSQHLPSLMTDASEMFLLTISHGSNRKVILLNESSHSFTAPKASSMCKIYNFTVAAAYVGATYTGRGCSIPSPVLSWTLPSLPDIDEVESSLGYLLTKQPGRGTILTVSFVQPVYCHDHKYILVLNGTTNESSWQHNISILTSTSSSEAVEISVDNLTDNAVLTFKLLVLNKGDEKVQTATTGMDIYTTDVQGVSVLVIEPWKTMDIMCEYVSGSDAKGCMVVLVGESDNVTLTLMRDDECTVKTIPLSSPLVYILGYDIESDGSIGTLPVLGRVDDAKRSHHENKVCHPIKDLQTDSGSGIPRTLIILVTCVLFIVVLFAFGSIIIIVTYCRFRRANSSVNEELPEKEECDEQQPTPFYEQPQLPSPKRKLSEDDSQYCRTSYHPCSLQVSPSHTILDADDAAYAKFPDNKDHVYHVLENDRAPRGVEVAKLTSNSDSNTSSDGQAPCRNVSSGMLLLSDPPSHAPPPPYRRHSAAPTSTPVYDDVIPRKFRPSLVPSTPTHPPSTPPKLPPPRASKLIRCDSEEFPPELPPRYRDSVLLSLYPPEAPLYDDVHPSDPSTVQNRLSIQIEDSPPHLPPPRSDTESPPPLPPPYRDSDVHMLLYDDVIPEESPSSTADNHLESSRANVGFSSPFLTCDSPPPETIIYDEISEVSANTQSSQKDA